MGQGLQIWDENGVNLVDVDYRLTQVLGSVYTGDLVENNAYMNGNIYVPQFENLSGTKFIHHIPDFSNHIGTRQVGVGSVSRQTARAIRIVDNWIIWGYLPFPQVELHDYASFIFWGVC